jgi:3-hydroxyisobutyrate dehydrogenase
VTRIALFGLGEAGTLLAADLVAAGADVHGFDPAPVATPPGVTRHDHPGAATDAVDLVMAVTGAADAEAALTQALDELAPEVLYADLATASAGLKEKLATTAAGRDVLFADVAIMAPVPGRGLGVPALASGPGAARYRDTVNPLGASVEVIDGPAGAAATRKLLRSVFMKGLAALVIEAMEAGHAAGQADWLWENLAHQITVADEALLARLVRGTGPHQLRRLHEMEASQALLEEIGVDPLMTRSTVESLRRVPETGLPELPGS